MKFIISWGNYDANSGQTIEQHTNDEILKNGLKAAQAAADNIHFLLEDKGYVGRFETSADELSQYEIAINIKPINHDRDLSDALIDEIEGEIVDFLKSWVDTPAVLENGNAVNPGFQPIEFKK